MGKKPKLTREEFSAIGVTTPGAPNEAKQKAAMTKEELAAVGTDPSVVLSNDPGMESPEHGASKYGVGHLQLQGNFQQHLGYNQPWTHEAANAGARLALDIVPGILGSIGAIGDVPDWAAGINSQTEEIGNSLTHWANQTRQHINEEMFPIYQQDQSPGVHLGSSEWWFDKGASVVESAVEFAALGFGMGSLITKGLTAAKWLTAIDAATGAAKLNALGEAIGTVSNAFVLNQAESILDATQTYDDEYRKNIRVGLDEHTAKVNAAQAAAHVVNLDRINILLNLTSVGAIMRGSRGTRNIKNLMNPVQRTILEGGQEYAEETVNFFAQNRGQEMGEALRTGKEYTGANIDKLMADMSSAQGIEAGFLGALGGMAQTGLTETIQGIKGTNRTEKDWIAEQQKILGDFDKLRAENKLSNVNQTATAIKEITSLIGTKKALEAEIAADIQAGKEPSTDKVVQVQQIEHQILAQQAFNNFQRGTTDYLEKAYQDIAALTDQQAKDNGFTEDELNPKSPVYYKTKANNALETIKKLEKEYLKASAYMNPMELFRSKAKELAIEKAVETTQLKLAEKAAEVSKAMTTLSRKIIMAPGVSNIFNTEDLDKTTEQEPDLSRQHVIKQAQKLPVVQEYKNLTKSLESLQDSLEAEQEFYAERSSEKVQKELKEARKKELAVAAEVEKGVKATQARVEQTKFLRKEEVAAQITEEAKALSDVNTNSAMVADDVNAMIEKTVDGVPLTPQELELLDKSPEHKALFENIIRRMAENEQAQKQANTDQIAGDPLNTTDTEVANVEGEQKVLGSTTLETILTGTSEEKESGKLTTAHNVLAWLARTYDKVFNPGKLTGAFADRDNNLNETMLNPDILDNRFIDVGDEVTFEVDPNGLMPVVENGQQVWKPWNGEAANQDIVPIVVKKGGVPFAHLHLPTWINSENTQGNIAEEQRKLRAIRKQVIESKTPVKSRVTARTLGKLFLTADKKPVPVSQALKDINLKYGVFYKNKYFTDGRSTEDAKELILNSASLKTGRSYVLVPVMHANNRAGREQTQYWAVSLLPQKLSQEVIESAAQAVKIHYKVIEGTELTEQDKKIVTELKKLSPMVNGLYTSFDITTPEGLKNYLNLFMYAEHHKDTGRNDQSLDDYLKTANVTTDYYAMDVGAKKLPDGTLTGVGVFFGSGKVGTVQRTGLTLDNYINVFKEFLGKIYFHSSLTYFNSGAQVPVIKADGTVTVLNQGGSYLDYLKEHVWMTNLVPHNISKDPAKPNYIYTLQQIIEYAPPSVETKQIITEEGKLKVVNPVEAAIISAMITPQFEDPDAEISEEYELPGVEEPEVISEEQIKTIKDRYRVPGISLRAQMSLVNWIAGNINDVFAKSFQEDPSSRKTFDYNGVMEASRAYLAKMVADNTKGAKFAEKVLENWSAVEKLTAYYLRTNFDYNIRRGPSSNPDLAVATEDKEEQHALNTWSMNTLEKNPTKSLTGRFKRFLAQIKNPTKDSIIPGFRERVNPDELYQYLSSILADTYPNFEEMVAKLQDHITSLGKNVEMSELPAFLEALQKADQQIKDEFVVAMSKHYVNMQHLYVVPRYRNQGTDFGYLDGYDVYIRNDNASSKSAVLKETWQTNLKLNRDNGLTQTAADQEGTLYFNNAKAGQLAEQFVYSENFDLAAWAKQLGIEFSPATAQVLKESKTIPVRIDGRNFTFEDFFKADNSPFKRIAIGLRSLQNREDAVKVDNSDFMNASFWRTLARLDSRYSDVAHSHTHRSGGKYVFSYADNKYLTDRFKELKNIDLLTDLADRSFSKHSWWLKQMLKTDAKGNYIKENGKVVLNNASPLTKNLSLNYVALQAMIEKGVANASRQALEELSVVEHEKAKLLFFQNKGTKDTTGVRMGEFFLMTLSNKNTMFTVRSTVPVITFKEDGTLSDQVVDMLFDNVVMPEIQRMKDFKAGNNINGYTEGAKLFYLFPKLNELPLFNEDGTPNGAIRGDVLSSQHREMINKVIRETIQNEITYKLDQWQRYGITKGEPGHMSLEAFDRSYISYVQSKLPAKSGNAAVAHYAAAEMAVSYMLVNTNMFQTVHMDPALYWKSKVEYDKLQQVQETFENITKRLGGEISPGRDLAQPSRGGTYKLAVIQDVKVPSKVLNRLQDIDSKLGNNNKDYANITSTDAVEFISLPEKINFMRQSSKLDPAQMDKADEILELHDKYMEAVREGKDPSRYEFNLDQLGFMLQVDKPIMVGTRVDVSGVETKVFVKSAAFTLIPQLIKGTELEKLALLMDTHKVDRLAFASAMKLGAPRVIKNVFDGEGNFINGSVLTADDMFDIDRRWLRLQQETPSYEDTEIPRVSQASKLIFVDILDKSGFRLPGSDVKYTGQELKSLYHKYYEEMYRLSKEELLSELGINPNQPEEWNPSPEKLSKLIEDELIKRGYPPHDLDTLAIKKVNGRAEFVMPPWALAKSGKLEAFLNAIVDSRIVDQKFNGYSFIQASEVGFRFKKETGKQQVKTEFKSVEEALSASGKPGIAFTSKFTGELKPAAANGGYHQVIVPWKFRNIQLSEYQNADGTIDFTKMDPELLKVFGMRIPNQGPNSTAAIEIVGFLPPNAGDMIIAPADFVVQMGSDFDIDKLYVYLPNYRTTAEGKLLKITTREFGNRQYLQNQIMDIHKSVNTNMNKEIQASIIAPLESQELRDIATTIDNQERKRTEGTVSVNNLAYISGTYQAQKYINSTVASTAIGAFAVQNTFNALSQYADLALTKGVDPEGKIRYSKIVFGNEVFNGATDFNKKHTIDGKAYKSHIISALLSAAVDDEKENILSRIGVNEQNISMVNMLAQAGFSLRTIAYFIKQDAIQEYCRQTVITGNEERALEAVLEQPRFALDKVKDAEFLQRGETVESASSDLVKILGMQISDTPVAKTFWNMYNSGVATMEAQIKDGEKARDYKYVQYALLLKFRDIMRNEVKTLRSVQALVNTDTKGPGKNMFESIEREKQLTNMVNSRLLGASELFGDFKEIYNTKGERHLSEDDIKALISQGYVRSFNYMFKPSTIPGFAMAYGVITNNRLWNRYFPYVNSSVNLAMSEIAASMGKEALDFTQQADRNRRIFRLVKQYVQTDKAVLPFSPNEVREKLLFDTSTNMSLASIWQKLREEDHPEIRNHKLLNNLFIVTQGERLPKMILFKKPQDSEWTNLDIYSQVIESLKHPKPLGVFNGITYTTKTFIEHLFWATKMAGTSGLQQEILQYMPVQYSVQIGESEALRNYDWSKLTLGKSDTQVVSNFTKQYFQHNPKLAPRIPGSVFAIGNVLQETEAEPETHPDFSSMEEFAPRKEIIKFQLKENAETKISRANTSMLPTFLAHSSGAATGYNLYMLTDAVNRIYTRIPTLGAINYHEFNANNELQSSLIPSNNPAPAYVPSPVIRTSIIAPSAPVAGKVRTTEENVAYHNRMAAYGLPVTQDSRVSKEQLKQILKNIARISTREDFRAAAEFLAGVVDNFDIKFTTGVTVSDADETKPVRGKAGFDSNGNLFAKINVNVLHTNEELEWTILHELSHAVTYSALKEPKNDRQRAAKRRLEELFQKYKAEHGGELKPGEWNELKYPAKNLPEFVVAALTQPEFRKVLNTMKYDDTHTFWDKIVEAFQKLMKSFGLEPDSTAAKAINDIMTLTDAVPSVVVQVAAPVSGEAVQPPDETTAYDEETGEPISLNPAVGAQLAELQKLLNKLDQNKSSETFDLPADGETDPRPEQPSKGTRFSKLVSELRAHKSQLEKRITELRLGIPKATVKQKVELKRRIENVQRNLGKINEQITQAQAVVKLEDLVVARGPADTELDEVNLLLAQGAALSFDDIDIINRKIKLWVNYAENFLTESERAVPGINDIFKDVFARAVKYQNQLEAIKKQKILTLAERMTGKKLDPKEFYQAITDINAVAAYTLSLDNADHALLQSVFAYMKEAEAYAQEEVITETEQLKELLAAVKNKEHITGKNLSNFIREDGKLIMPYSQAYLDTKYKHSTAAKDFKAKGDDVNAKKEWDAFRKFIKENDLIIDLRKLVKLPGHEEIHAKNAGKLEKELREVLGNTEYERKLKRAQDLYNNYLADLENYTADVNLDSNIVDKADQIKLWVSQHNPFQYTDYMEDVQGAIGNAGYKYVEVTPKAVDAKGKPTGWYDEKYKAIQSDPDVAKLHDHIVNLLVKLRRYLPESTARDFGTVNALPALQKSLIESLKTEGLAAAMTQFWDSTKKGLTSGDVVQELYGGLKPNRYLTVQVDSITNKINKLYNQKLADYMRQNMLSGKDIDNIDPEVLAGFREEATQEITGEVSLDLKSMLGIYTAAVIDYRHKSRIEDAVRLAEDVFNTHIQEYKTNAAGKGVIINEEGRKGQEIEPAGLKNMRAMLKHTLDKFFRVPRTIEGKTEQKLYTKKEQKRKAALEEELKKYNGDLTSAEKQLAELRDSAEGMPSAEYAQKEQKATELKTAAENRIAIVNQELEKLGRVMTGTGIADNLLNYLMVKGLGWNPFSGLNNMGFGWVSNITEAAAGTYFNESQILAGYKLAMNSVAKFWSFNTYQNQTASKIRTLMDNMRVLHKPSEELFTTTSAVTGAASSLHWANIQNRTEYLNQAPVMIAMMLGYKINRKDGTESNLWEAYGKDGKWDQDTFGSIETAFPARDRAKFNTWLSEAIRKIHGNYDPAAPILIKDSIAGRMLSVFRTWAFEGFATRFEKPSTNFISDIQRKGRYRSYGGGSMALVGAGLGSLILTPGLGTAIGTAVGVGVGKLWANKERFREGQEDTSMFEELFLETKYLVRKLSFGLVFKNTNLEDKFTTTDAANLRKNMTEISMLMYLMGFAILLKGLKDDEDDEELKYAMNYQLNVMQRLTQDIGFYADPVSFQKILRDPIPATSTIEDSFKWIQAANRYLQGDDEIATGQYAHESRLNRATGRLVPFWKQIVTTQDLLLDVRK